MAITLLMLHPAANVMTSRPPAASGQEVITNIDRLVEHSIQTVNDSGKSVFIDMRYKRDRGQYHIGPASGLRAADGCWVLTASCSRANSRRRSPGRVKRRWNSGSWNQPLKFSTPPLNCGSPAEMNTGPTPNRRHSRITRDRVRAAGPQPASSRALSSWTWAGRSRSFQHCPPRCNSGWSASANIGVCVDSHSNVLRPLPIGNLSIPAG